MAQCPIASNCTPGNPPVGNLVFGMGIFSVNINNGAINNTTAGASQGYQDYSCTLGATLIATVSTPISIQTNLNVNENVRVWIDYNNDGSFNATTELAFSSNNQKLHTGTITIPATAVMNTPLRMRVSADNFSSPIPTPCSTPQYSQVEDYQIMVMTTIVAPVAGFSASNTTTCASTVSFTDLSQNGPTNWSWNFGDTASGAANTSTLQNPAHNFSAPGIYTVSLTACNTNGCNTLTRTNYIVYHTNVPVAAACTPNTASYCCNYGITNINFGNGLMTNSSANGVAGYQDFTCTKSVTAMAGNTYPISLITGPNPHDTRIYIDLNNDGSFTGSTEMVLQMLNQANPTGSITVPVTNFLNTPLRMRIISDETGSNFTSCTGVQLGQAEDYSIIIIPAANPPVAQFTSNHITRCDSTVQFTDQSTHAPTAWSWDFGDPASGTSNYSNLQNPVHTYRNAGNYTVSLTVTNANGTNTQTKPNYITVTNPCLNYCTSSGHNNNTIFISNVTLNNLNHTSLQSPNGYSDFTSHAANVVRGDIGRIWVTRGGSAMSSSVSAWIDYNRNGTFEASEQIMALQSSPTLATVNFTVPATALLGPTRMRVITTSHPIAPPNPCMMYSLSEMEVEDYTVNIQPVTQPPVATIKADLSNICTGLANFQDNSRNAPTSWHWDFGDPVSGAANTSTQRNPSHTYPTGTAGSYTVTLVTCNNFGCDTATINNAVNITVPCLSYCPSNGSNVHQWISNVSIGSLNNSTTVETNGYGNYTYLGTDLMKDNTFLFSATIGNPVATAVYVSAWIDLNKDGIFQTTERLINLPATNLAPTVTGNITIPNTVADGATRMRVVISTSFNLSSICGVNNYNAEVEDYTINIIPNSQPPVTAFKVDLNGICTGLVSFQDNSAKTPTSWLWNFGDPASGPANTSTLQNPVHIYSTATPGSYSVTLISCNSFGCDTVTMNTAVNITVPCLTYCVSNGHQNVYRYITNVNLGNINNPTAQETRGYGNYTYLNASLIQGTSANPLKVTTEAFSTFFGFVAAWIDFNQDGIFQPGERVFNGPSTRPTPGASAFAEGNLAIPNNALPGITRMRVILSGYSLPGPCMLGQSDTEVEDYTVNILPNQLPPVTKFKVLSQLSCNGSVQFTDSTDNNPTSWLWDFGDNASGAANTSTLQNPVHVFSAPGQYTVSLTTTNNYGTSTISKPNYINYAPASPACSVVSMPATGVGPTLALCSGSIYDPGGPSGMYGGGANGIITIAPAGAATVSLTFSMVSMSSCCDFLRIYDGPSTKANLIRTINGSGLPVPATITSTGPVLTLEFISDNASASHGFAATWNCTPIAAAPVAAIKPDLSNLCTGFVKFQDNSTNSPTSWSWNFGDPGSGAANTSSLQNPTHTYPAGTISTYPVTLIACNSFGCDTVVMRNIVNITVPCRSYCVSTGHSNAYQWIRNVSLGTINNTTYKEPGGYGNYTYLSTDLIQGTAGNQIAVGINYFGGTVNAWIDFNQDGVFQQSELVLNVSMPNSGAVNHVVNGNIAIPGSALLGPTRMRVISTMGNTQTGSCTTNMYEAEVEDYLVNIIPNVLPPVASFTVPDQLSCNGTVQFTETSINIPSSWLWNFGDPASGADNTSTLQNPSHTFSAPGMYTVSLTATNTFGSDTLTRTNFINYDPGNALCNLVSMPATGTGPTAITCNGTVYDPGGPNGQYGNLSSSTLTIAPPGAGPVTLTFSLVDIENSDFLRIYDGPGTNSRLLTTITGTQFPVTVTSTGGALTLSFVSNGSVVRNGFAATWSCSPVAGPPVARIKADFGSICTGGVSFQDASSNVPTSWSWDFGDPASGAANTSSLQNPTHAYPAGTAGAYPVTLIACNSFGCDTITINNFVSITVPCLSYCNTTGHSNLGQWMSNVNFGAINNTTSQEVNGYGNYIYQSTAVLKDTYLNTMSVTLGNRNWSMSNFVAAFIDFNQDGIFQQSERAFNVLASRTSATDAFVATGSISIPKTASNGITRMRVVMSENGNLLNACQSNLFGAEVEDYAVIIQTPAGLQAGLESQAFTVYPNPGPGLVYLKMHKHWQEDFKLEVINVLGEVLIRKELSFADGREKQLDLRDLPKGVYFLKVQNYRMTGIRKVVIN